MDSVNRWHSLPAQVYALVEDVPATVLLDAAKPATANSGSESGSRLFTAPIRVCAVTEPAELPGLFAEIESAVAKGLYAAGFFAYECGNCFEPRAAMRPAPIGQPLAWIGIYERCYLFDHRIGAFVGGDPPGFRRLSGRQCGDRITPEDRIGEEPIAEEPIRAIFSVTEKEYGERIEAIHEWIRSGDVYQLNFTSSLALATLAGPGEIYARLRRFQPVNYGAFVHWQADSHILSFSPELFFRLEEHEAGQRTGRRITTRPMKGTAPRGRTTAEDAEIAEWLRNDPKNRSENVMIVDLLRNDLGRICRFGSVKVESLFAAERYQTLWQMTSTVTGELRPEAGLYEIFRALFPCGSVTGAPKVRAMQLLAKVEEQPRGVYTGSIGFFSRERTVFNVAIRTLELQGGQGRMGVGSGIVIDSNAGDEFEECQLKAAFLGYARERSRQEFSLVETLLWRDGYPLLELHLDRLQDSASYFGFDCDRGSVRAALVAASAELQAGQPHKVRLLMDSDGGVHLERMALAADAGSKRNAVGRVRISEERTDPQDAMLFHKTTYRPIYTEASKAAAAAGLDDVLFLNLHGELTEGAISNVFVEAKGRWFTPPVKCGLLAGVYRRHLLETRPEIEERVLRTDDLRCADAIYLANAVRGLRRVTVDWEG